MLATQEFLMLGNRFEDLTEQFGIRVYRHEVLPLVGLKYSQTESPRTHPIVRECRGLVLDENDFSVVAKSFRRFFNAGDDAENFRNFNWSDFTTAVKEDGSLILLFNYQGTWQVSTSGGWGYYECCESGKSWAEIFWDASAIDLGKLDSRTTYVFELCSPYNKVVRSYPKPVAFLLSMFDVTTLQEATIAEADKAAIDLGVPRPQIYSFASRDEITAFLRERSLTDKTFEGFVIRDDRNERYKIKSETYLTLHHLLDNGRFNPRRVVPFVLSGTTEEIHAYFPEHKRKIEKVHLLLSRHFDDLLSLWKQTWRIESQKDFAMAIVKRTLFSDILFSLRRDHKGNQTESHLRDAWRANADRIAKLLF